MTRRAIPGLVLIASLLLYSALAVRFYQHIVDDAYISFRYAQNFADGHGFVFNPGETVEGYTNFLWVLLLGLGLKLNLDPELASRLLGFAAGAGVLVASNLFGRRFGLSPATQWIAPLLLAVHPALTVWATGGARDSPLRLPRDLGCLSDDRVD
ncbi:hypothetical protein N9903_00905 [bacterium]|nr:hypothetical protein [bacterium]